MHFAQRLRIAVPALIASALCLTMNSVQADSVIAQAPKLRSITVAYSTFGYQYGDVLVAKDQHLFEKYGLDVNLVQLNSSAQLAGALKSGSIQIAEGDAAPVATAIMKGIDLRFLGQNIAHFTAEMWAIPGITKVTDLKGKTVGSSFPGALSDSALTAVLNKFGMQRSDVQIVNFQTVPAKVAALRTRAIAASLINPPVGNESAKFGCTMIYNSADIPNISNAYVAEAKYAAANSDIVVAFLKATREADMILKKDPAKAKPIVNATTNVPEESLNDYAYTYFKPLYEIDPSIDLKVLNEAFLAEAKRGNFTAPADISSYVVTGPINELKKSGFLSKMIADSK